MLVFFYSIESFLARLFSSNAAKQFASALEVGQSAAKDIGMKANDVGKTLAIDAGKKLINLNKLIDRSSPRHPTASKANAIAIQDLVKRMNWFGLKEIYHNIC